MRLSQVLTDFKKINKELNWNPSYSFDNALESTIDWYLNNQDWCKRVQKNANYNSERLGSINYQDSGFVFTKSLNDDGDEVYEKEEIEPGRVFKQFPAKDIMVKIGRRVNLWIVQDSINEKNQ